MTVSISPLARQQYLDINGNPISGGKLFSYIAGTTTKTNTYTSSTGGSANTNPILLDSSGRTPSGVWLTDGTDYKFVLAPSTDTDPPSSPIWTEDHIKTTAITSASALSEWINPALTPTYINGVVFTLVGDQRTEFHVGRRIKATVTAGNVYGIITASVYTSLTTVAVSLDAGASLDNGLSIVYYSILTYTNHAVPNVLTNSSQIWGTKNRIINGNFDIWQRATTQSANGILSADKWGIFSTGTTFSSSQQTHTLGQTSVPWNPKYYMQHIVTSIAGSTNCCYFEQRMEGVQNLANESATVTFYAKADAAKNISLEFVQNFGTTGAPSGNVIAIGSQKIALTTAWSKYTVTVAIPSVGGKTLGSDGNDYLSLVLWMDAGSAFNSETATLGQQSGTFSFSQIQIETGSTASSFELRPLEIESNLCRRYYQQIFFSISGGSNNASTTVKNQFTFPIVMRGIPSVNVPTLTYVNASGLSIEFINANSFRTNHSVTAAGFYRAYSATDLPIESSADL